MIKINYYGTLDKSIDESGVNSIELYDNDSSEEILSGIFKSEKHNMLGWLKLPYVDNSVLLEIENAAKNIRESFDNFVVLGIGGSALGTKALYNAFSHKKTKLNFYVCDNIDPDGFIETINSLDVTKTLFNVITKSGSTSETLAQLMIILNKFEEVGYKNFNDNIIITTEKDNRLDSFAKESNIKTFEVPKDVGGRFSVLSPVGLLPAAVYGIDISELVLGAKHMLEVCSEQDIRKNPALMFAKISYLLDEQGKEELIIFPYSDKLSLFSDYHIQLWSESLGKELDMNNNKIHSGQTPVKAVGVTDQHSQMQLFCEGPNNKLIMFLKTEEELHNCTIKESTLKGFDYLVGTNLKELLDYEQSASAYALTKSGRPNLTISIEKIDEFNIGELLFFFQIATAFIGEMFNINTYNQPGVENGKIYTMALLNRKGYEKQKEEIFSYMEKAKDFTV